MKVKRINLSFFILTSLVMVSLAFLAYAQEQRSATDNIFLDSDQDGLSDAEEKVYGTDIRNPDSDGDSYSDGAEVRSGYDPMKPAPGDKLETPENPRLDAQVLGEESAINHDENNLTQKMAEKISTMSEDNQDVTLEDMQSMMEDALNSGDEETAIPDITADQIKIKEQNYKGTDEQIKAKKKEDFINYIVAVYYILSSNSPKPVTSMSNLASVGNDMASQLLMAVSARDSKALDDIALSGQKTYDQMMEVEVPEDLADMHIKGLRFAQYSMSMKSKLDPNIDDPMTDIANLSKISGLLDALGGFAADVSAKFAEYDITYDENMINTLKDSGLLAPEDTPENEELLESVVPEE